MHYTVRQMRGRERLESVPADMLRYDRAEVVREQPGEALLYSPQPPTAARWDSFGWMVEPKGGWVQ